MFVAGGLEMIRKADIEKNGVLIQDVAGVFHNASHLTIFYQVFCTTVKPGINDQSLE